MSDDVNVPDEMVTAYQEAWHATPQGRPGDRTRAGLKAALSLLDDAIHDDLLDFQDQLTEMSRWLDEAPANAARTPLEQTLMRFLKIGEENGEMVAEIIGMTGQNPRKGVTSDIDKVIGEALDVAITALGAVEHATGNQGDALALMLDKMSKVHARMQGAPSADAVASDVKIDKFLDREPNCDGPAHPLRPGQTCYRCLSTEVAGLPGWENVTAEPPVIVTEPPVDPDAPMESRTGHRHDDTDPWSVDGDGKPTAYVDGCLIQENATRDLEQDCGVDTDGMAEPSDFISPDTVRP